MFKYSIQVFWNKMVGRITSHLGFLLVLKILGLLTLCQKEYFYQRTYDYHNEHFSAFAVLFPSE